MSDSPERTALVDRQYLSLCLRGFLLLVLKAEASSKQQKVAYTKWNMNTEKTFTQQMLAELMQEAHKGPCY